MGVDEQSRRAIAEQAGCARFWDRLRGDEEAALRADAEQIAKRLEATRSSAGLVPSSSLSQRSPEAALAAGRARWRTHNITRNVREP
jgi:hypothetical protein